MIRFLKLCAAVVGLGLGLVLPAFAQTLPASAIALAPGNYLTVDGVTITVDGADCSQGSSGCYNLYMVPTSGPDSTVITEGGPGLTTTSSTVDTSPIASVVIEAASGGIGSALEPLESESCGTSCNGRNYDLTVQLTATTVAGSAPLTGASVSITGVVPPGGSGVPIEGHETLSGTSDGGCSSALTVTLAASTASCSFAASTSVSAVKDFGIVGPGGVAGTYQLSTITETFATPEPASLACLLPGAFALVAVRRRRRRQA